MASRQSRSEGRSKNHRQLRDRPVTRHNNNRSRSRSPLQLLDQDNPANWTLSKLREKLKEKNITLPNNTPHSTLVSLYNQMTVNKNVDQDRSDTDTGVTQRDQNLAKELRQMQASLAELTRKMNDSAKDREVQGTSHTRGLGTNNSTPASRGLSWLNETIVKLWDSAHASGTVKVYNVGYKLFTRFLEQNSMWHTASETPPSVNERTLIYFVAFCSQRGLRYVTIKQYLAGIRYFYLKHGVTSPLFHPSKLHQLQVVLRGVKKSQLNVKQQRLPITHDILKDIVICLQRAPLGQFNSLLMATACTLAFWGFLRCGEFTLDKTTQYEQSAVLRISDIEFSETCDGFSLHLSNSKADVFRTGVSIQVSANPTVTCPISLMQEYVGLRLKSGAQPRDPLFITVSGKVLSRNYFIQNLRSILELTGRDTTSLYNGHSFRIGAATTAGLAAIQDHLIKTLGRWSSDCYQRYVQVDKTAISRAHHAMSNQ